MKHYIFALIIILTSCIARSTVKIDNPELHEIQSSLIIKKIKSLAMTGDWLVIRGYHAVDNLVANATVTPISHVAVYNAETQMVIEAEGEGVHSTTLKEFVNKSYRLLIIRPRWLNEANSTKAFSIAKSFIGNSYDFLGTVGFDYPDKFYCSELAISIYREWYRPNEKFPRVIKPGDLYLYGTVLYDSLPRDEF